MPSVLTFIASQTSLQFVAGPAQGSDMRSLSTSVPPSSVIMVISRKLSKIDL